VDAKAGNCWSGRVAEQSEAGRGGQVVEGVRNPEDGTHPARQAGDLVLGRREAVRGWEVNPTT
jgi:hypothetical protein